MNQNKKWIHVNGLILKISFKKCISLKLLVVELLQYVKIYLLIVVEVLFIM